MTHTPSLSRRLTTFGVGVVVLVVAVIEVFLYLSMRSTLLADLERVLDERARLATAEAFGSNPPALANRLTVLGIRATVKDVQGVTYEAQPPSPVLGDSLAAPQVSLGPVVTRAISLPDGSTLVLYVRRAGADHALRRLVIFEALGLVIAAIMATALLRRTMTRGLKPLRSIAESARRTSAGQRGVRLEPDQPDTHLGQLATAHDDMVAALERAIDDADHARDRSERLHEKTRQVIETATASFISFGADGTVTEWNAAAERTFGWLAEEIIGARLSDTTFLPVLADAVGRGALETPVELPACRRDGHVFPVEVTAWAMPGDTGPMFNAFIQDISERRRGEEASARLAAIVDAAQEAIFSRSMDGIILTWNRGAELQFGFSADEAIGQPEAILVPADRAGEASAFAAQIARGEPVSRHETVRRCKNGTEIEVALTISPIRAHDGTVIGASSIGRDISEQRWMADTLNSMIEALEDALDEARSSEDRSRHFLADAAHQLRTPLAGIRACAETLLRGVSIDQRDRLLADMVRETSRAGRLLSSLLQLARLDRGELLSRLPCDALQLCRSEAERTEILAPDLHVTVHVVGAPPPPVHLDRHAVEQILGNLLENSRRHAVSRADVMVRADDQSIEIGVTDDGPGVPADLTGRLFERFVSLDGKGGSGLGLAIARQLAWAHGGDLVYRGKVFLLSLPIDVTSESATGTPGNSAGYVPAP